MYSKQREAKSVNILTGEVVNLDGTTRVMPSISWVLFEVEGIGRVSFAHEKNHFQWRTGEEAVRALTKAGVVPSMVSENVARNATWVATFVATDDAGNFLSEQQIAAEVSNTLRVSAETAIGPFQFILGEITGIHVLRI